jgi:hypothetical protein
VSRIVSKLMAGAGVNMVPHTVGTIRTSLQVPADPVPEHVSDLARRVALELAQRRLARLQGSPATYFDPLLKPVSGLTLSGLIERFERDRMASGRARLPAGSASADHRSTGALPEGSAYEDRDPHCSSVGRDGDLPCGQRPRRS